MKNTLFPATALLIFLLAGACTKKNYLPEPDCAVKAPCFWISYGYRACHFDETWQFTGVWADTARSPVSVCDTIKWISDTRGAHARYLLNHGTELDWRFEEMYPFVCQCY